VKQSKNLSFDDLKRDVVDKGLCNKCGSCVSFCTASRVGAIEMCGCNDNIPQWVDPDKCYNCGICYLICPQTQDLNEAIRDEYDWVSPAGRFSDIVTARATDKEILKVATDGGVVTSLLLYMLENNIIDGAIVSRRTGLFSREPDIVTTREGLIEAAGSSFAEAQLLDEVGQKYTDYVPIIPAVQLLGPKRTIRLAAVGTPCQILGIRKMQSLNILPSDIIHFTIGLFCMQCFAFDNLMEKGFIKKHQINPVDIKKINVKDDFRLELGSGVTVHIPFEEIEDIARPACLVCRDFANDFADISVGGLGSPDGFTTAMIRTTIAKRLFTDALNKGYLETTGMSDTEKAGISKLIGTYVTKKQERTKIKLEELDKFDYIDDIIAKTSNSTLENTDFLSPTDIDNLCSECENLNRHLSWVIGFVSHELSNTIGTTLMNISALANPEISSRITDEKKKKMLFAAIGSMKLMQDMLRNYLASSKVNNGQLSFSPNVIDLGKDIIEKVIRRLETSLRIKEMKFVCNNCKGLQVECDLPLIRICINNLINNAIKYGTEKTTIQASVKEWNGGFEFTIRNEGIGIPKDKLVAVFDEFSRFDSLGIGGTGLGLFLVKKIASMHGGEIFANGGFIIDNEFVTYDIIDKNPDKFDVDFENKASRKFATFTLRIPGREQAENNPKNVGGK